MMNNTLPAFRYRDAAAFLAATGRQELEDRWPDAIPPIRTEAGYQDGDWADTAILTDSA